MPSQYNNLSVKDLRKLCAENELEVNGKKSVLVKRLVDFDKFKNRSGLVNSTVETIFSPNNTEREPERVNMNRQSAFSFSDIKDLIDEFIGDENQNVKQWLDDYESNAEVFGFSDVQKLVYSKRLMSGDAKSFVQCESSKIKTWAEFKAALIKEFSVTVNSALIHKKLAERKKQSNESFRDYCYKMISIASQAQIEESAIVVYIVDGIQDHINNKAFLYEVKNVAELKEKLKLYELIKSKRQSSEVEHSSKEKQKTQEKYVKTDKKRTCFNCGEENHECHNCPHREKGPKCFKCQNFGHQSKDCSFASTITVEKEVNIVAVKNEKVYKNVKINDCSVQALLDTGSDVTVMKENVFKKFSFGVLDNSKISIRGIGTKVTTVGGFDAKFEIDGLTLESKCHIVSNSIMSSDVLIGMDVLQQADVRISKKGVYIEKPVEEITKELPIIGIQKEKVDDTSKDPLEPVAMNVVGEIVGFDNDSAVKFPENRRCDAEKVVLNKPLDWDRRVSLSTSEVEIKSNFVGWLASIPETESKFGRGNFRMKRAHFCDEANDYVKKKQQKMNRKQKTEDRRHRCTTEV